MNIIELSRDEAAFVFGGDDECNYTSNTVAFAHLSGLTGFIVANVLVATYILARDLSNPHVLYALPSYTQTFKKVGRGLLAGGIVQVAKDYLCISMGCGIGTIIGWFVVNRFK
jgi:hypothetical protein